jgi:hypothetical protein
MAAGCRRCSLAVRVLGLAVLALLLGLLRLTGAETLTGRVYAIDPPRRPAPVHLAAGP